jgi:imidazolonepropionase-like amidohydrolase
VLASLSSPRSWTARVGASEAAVEYYTRRHQQTIESARRAVAGGASIVAGSDAGNPRAFHGLGLIRELELLVEEAGMSPEAALIAATGTASQRLRSTEVGRIAPRAFADLVVFAADPTKDIHALRQIRAVYFGGRRLERETLLSTSPGTWMPRAGVELR